MIKTFIILAAVGVIGFGAYKFYWPTVKAWWEDSDLNPSNWL